jgi:hypothetical protein
MKHTTQILTISLAFLFFSCSKSIENRSSKELLSAYLKDNSKYITFGSIDIKKILDKADYKSIPKVNVLLMEEMKQFEGALDLSEGISFVVEGSINTELINGTVLAIAKVKNVDSLINKVSSLGYTLKDTKGIKFMQDKEVSIGVKQGIAIFMTKQGKYDGLKELETAFKKCEKEESTGKVADILKQNADILVGFSMENFYKNSTEMLTALSKEKQKELLAMMNDSYVDAKLNFENGKAELISRNLFSDLFVKRLYLDEDNQASIVKKLGKGNARFGLSMNMNVGKIQSFMDDFVPDFKKQLAGADFQLQMAMSVLGNDPFAAIWNGKLGLVLVGDAISDGSFVPEFNFHFGLGKKGKEVNELLSAFTAGMSKNANGDYEMEGMSIKINDKEITGFSNKNASKSNSLKIPEFAKDFGKKGFSGFMDFDGVDMKSLELGDELKGIYAIKSIYFEGDNNGSKLIISAKKSNVNILKQIADVYLQDIKQKIDLLN